MPTRIAGRERHPRRARVVDRAQPDRGLLVRRAVVRAAGLGPQPRRGGLQHHPHRRRHRPQPRQLLGGHHPGVEVGQHAGLVEHGPRAGADVVDRRGVAVRGEPGLRCRPARLGPVAEGEQRLGAALRGALAGDGEDVVDRQVRRGQAPGDGDERAVVAAVAAQPGQRDEHLGAVGDQARAALRVQVRVAAAGREGQHLRQLVAAGPQQRAGVLRSGYRPVAGAPQGSPHLRGGGPGHAGPRRSRDREISHAPERTPGSGSPACERSSGSAAERSAGRAPR